MKMLAFVEAQMHRIAPNLTKLVGANIASRLLGLAGGLAELAKVPGGYIFSLGQVRGGHSYSLSLPFFLSLPLFLSLSLFLSYT